MSVSEVSPRPHTEAVWEVRPPCIGGLAGAWWWGGGVREAPRYTGSVAIAYLVAMCLVSMPHVEVRRRHLCSHFWRNRGCQRTRGAECNECFGPPSHARWEVLREAVDVFRRAMAHRSA